MIRNFLLFAFALIATTFATEDNPYASIIWTENNVPKGCFPDKKNRILCEDFQNSKNRTIQIIDPTKSMMYFYILKEGKASIFDASYCNDLMPVPTNMGDEPAKALRRGDITKYTELLTEAMKIGNWGWNCGGNRTIKKIFCMLNNKEIHYAKISKYDEMGLLDSEKETTVNSIIGDFCREIFDGI